MIPFLARRLGRPVRWLEDRHEHLLSAAHSRDQLHEVEVGFDGDGRILALRDNFIVDCGAWNPIGGGVPYNTAAHLTGPYKIDNLAVSARTAATNKVPNTAYRGAGRPEAVFAMERIIDLVAGSLGLEPAEVRRRNMIRAEEMPYHAGIAYRDGEPIVYDGGDYPGGSAEGARCRRRRRGVPPSASARRADKAAIWGSASAAMSRGPGSGRSRVRPCGSILRARSMSPPVPPRRARGWRRSSPRSLPTHGRSHPTTSSSRSPTRPGSRAGPVRSPAAARSPSRRRSITRASACERRRLRSPPICWNAPPADLELRDGGVGVVGVPGAAVSLAKLAHAARPGWDHGRPQGIDAGLEETHYWEPPTVTWSYAAHVAIVEVDREIGRVTIEKYAIAHDCGVVVNPLLVEGQIAGGTAQGLGGILLEDIVYDPQGQLLTGSLADYMVPTAGDVPDMALIHQHSPSPLNPLGVKGVGEGGAVAPPAAIANAIADALAPFGAEFNTTPIKPEQIVAAARSAPRHSPG